MKFYETHFEEYLAEHGRVNLHPKLEGVYARFPATLDKLKNLIFYGPSGTGKYTQMLSAIKRYSPRELKYERKIIVTFNKQQYFFKVSDIHFEIDMSLLGCNSKLLWHDIYQQIVDIVSAKHDKTGILVCKAFQEIHSELLDNFYSYMQQNHQAGVHLHFILLTSQLSFLPDNILNCCQVIHVARPTKTQYQKCLQKKLPVKVNTEHITNIKLLHCYDEHIMQPHHMVCNKILRTITHVNELQFLKFRDLLYDVFIYNLDVAECVWYLLSKLAELGMLREDNASQVLVRTYLFFQYFNNNYRPIYHIENYLLFLTQLKEEK
jgi:hypothetical protein